MRPYLTSENQPESYMRIQWGREGEVSEIQDDGSGDGERWSECSVALGIVGILTLFSGIHFLSKLSVRYLEYNSSSFLHSGHIRAIGCRST